MLMANEFDIVINSSPSLLVSQTDGMNVADFTFHSDGQPVGMLSQRKEWHKTVYGDFLKSSFHINI